MHAAMQTAGESSGAKAVARSTHPGQISVSACICLFLSIPQISVFSLRSKTKISGRTRSFIPFWGFTETSFFIHFHEKLERLFFI
jgi:hypothetical protein